MLRSGNDRSMPKTRTDASFVANLRTVIGHLNGPTEGLRNHRSRERRSSRLSP